ncbi:MAG: type III pantothenate kinase [Thermoguttaceae bacterium]|nr:type III pantothenate kinase [Thermoguttaceae bacterium]MDW8079407.1 type III pantothenate kinase [Thermoguttaceae bacterium]
MDYWWRKLEEVLASPAVQAAFPIVAVDVGNNRIKCGWYEWTAMREGGPYSAERALSQLPQQLSELEAFAARGELRGGWWIATVNRAASTELIDWIRTHRPEDRIVLLTASDLPLPVNLPRPDMVGIDRLVDALAGFYLRRESGPIVVVDVGSAITVDFVSAEGVFEGGAILPGLGLAARALYEFTDMLPLVDSREFNEPPPPVGKNTVAAMKSGLFWGALGAVAQLAGQMLREAGAPGEIILTGGGSTIFARLLGEAGAEQSPFRKQKGGGAEFTLEHFGRSVRVRHVPHLTLLGVALAAGWVMATTQWR